MAKAKPLPPDAYPELLFPNRGLDVSVEFNQQRPGTTPVGLNVRVFEALTQRGRGGSRAGLGRYIDGLVGGPNKIQHINYIVDPQAVGLIDNEPDFPDPVDPEGTPDPRHPGRRVRTGGTGVQTNKAKDGTTAYAVGVSYGSAQPAENTVVTFILNGVTIRAFTMPADSQVPLLIFANFVATTNGALATWLLTHGYNLASATLTNANFTVPGGNSATMTMHNLDGLPLDTSDVSNITVYKMTKSGSNWLFTTTYLDVSMNASGGVPDQTQTFPFTM